MGNTLRDQEWRQHCRAKGISENSLWVSDWIDRMAREHGPLVSGYGRKWDWGQALCLDRYGLDLDTWPDSPTNEDVQRAIEWERGVWPGWARRGTRRCDK